MRIHRRPLSILSHGVSSEPETREASVSETLQVALTWENRMGVSLVQSLKYYGGHCPYTALV